MALISARLRARAAAVAKRSSSASSLFDHGVDPQAGVIRVGLNTDLSGVFATHALRAADGHLAYWEWVNANGGIRGWRVVPVVMDNRYDVGAHVANYEAMSAAGAEGVVMFSVSAGSPHNAAIAARLAEDGMAAVAYARDSRLADPGFGANLLEAFASFCVESMNGATHMADTWGDKAALVTLDNDYGRDSAAGFRMAASQLGVEIAYDGQGAVAPGVYEGWADGQPRPEIAEIADAVAASGADWVWLATDPRTTHDLLLAAERAGYGGQWSGNSPSWSPLLLLTPARGIADKSYTHSSTSELSNTGDSDGMAEMVAAMRWHRPSAPFDDLYVNSFVQGHITAQILDRAAANKDLTRAGVLAAANQITADLKGLAPDQTWSGDPDDNIVRHTYIYDVDASVHTPSLQTDEQLSYWLPLEYRTQGRIIAQDDNNAGYTLIKGPYTSPTAQNWDYQPCH